MHDDWNPWNDWDSEGTPNGRYITLSEVIEANNCFFNGTPAPHTDAQITISMFIDLYNAYSNGEPM
ncbi:hypothetical protein [Methanococcoides seepicolus]|uniref:Uncharacterized protein n=1 Tax=Methanococcoides seepicolus TaxID=2828780 RepID=A0A9E4ZHH4_9EURY|nr:hypothetical protein [Methanococcoides seepicolus]MCM1987049.1 hypothetical protein [Methanococcoides seepicolus]